MESFLYSGNPTTGYNTPGKFERVSRNSLEWVERQGNQVIWRFEEISSDPTWLILEDSGRNMLIALPQNGGKSYFMKYSGPFSIWNEWIRGNSWTELYEGISAH